MPTDVNYRLDYLDNVSIFFNFFFWKLLSIPILCHVGGPLIYLLRGDVVLQTNYWFYWNLNLALQITQNAKFQISSCIGYWVI